MLCFLIRFSYFFYNIGVAGTFLKYYSEGGMLISSGEYENITKKNKSPTPITMAMFIPLKTCLQHKYRHPLHTHTHTQTCTLINTHIKWVCMWRLYTTYYDSECSSDAYYDVTAVCCEYVLSDLFWLFTNISRAVSGSIVYYRKQSYVFLQNAWKYPNFSM